LVSHPSAPYYYVAGTTSSCFTSHVFTHSVLNYIQGAHRNLYVPNRTHMRKKKKKRKKKSPPEWRGGKALCTSLRPVLINDLTRTGTKKNTRSECEKARVHSLACTNNSDQRQSKRELHPTTLASYPSPPTSPPSCPRISGV
jgi:hypothetical protein